MHDVVEGLERHVGEHVLHGVEPFAEVLDKVVPPRQLLLFLEAMSLEAAGWVDEAAAKYRQMEEVLDAVPQEVGAKLLSVRDLVAYRARCCAARAGSWESGQGEGVDEQRRWAGVEPNYTVWCWVIGFS